jgi:hypothetical protein
MLFPGTGTALVNNALIACRVVFRAEAWLHNQWTKAGGKYHGQVDFGPIGQRQEIP